MPAMQTGRFGEGGDEQEPDSGRHDRHGAAIEV